MENQKKILVLAATAMFLIEVAFATNYYFFGDTTNASNSCPTLLNQTQIASGIISRNATVSLTVSGSEDIERYEVFGKDIVELNSSMRQRTPAPQGYYAYARVVHTKNRKSNSTSTHTDIQLDYKITTILPEWNRTSGSPELQLEWDRYITALRGHEEGHVRIFRAAIEKIKEVGDPDRVDEIFNASQVWSDDYDKITSHGELQGARLGYSGTTNNYDSLIDSYINKITCIN